MPALGSAQTVRDAPAPPAAAPNEQQPPVQQPPVPQSPAQQPPAQPPGTPPAPPPATVQLPLPQQPPTQPAPGDAPQQPEGPHIKLPPPPPKIVDVRMPGEAGYFIGFSGWLPMGSNWVDKGHGSTFTDPSKLQLAGKSKGAEGLEIGIAAGLHNSIRVSYFQSKISGTTQSPATESVIFSQVYEPHNDLSTNAKMTVAKVSFEYLTWPYPVERRHFRFKTLYQMQYVQMKSIFDEPILSATPSSAGVFTSYSTNGSKSFFSPTLGVGVHEYATRRFRFEANASGFMLPHRWQIWDVDGTVAYRAGSIELRAGVKAFHFRTSPNADYYYRATVGGVLVGLRWYSD
jgi:hypothetical protein